MSADIKAWLDNAILQSVADISIWSESIDPID